MLFCDIENVTLRQFKSGDVLIAAGEPVEYVYYLLSGIVNREMITIGGNEYIIGQRKSGKGLMSLVGVLIIYDEWSVASEDFIAVTDCLCYQIPKDTCKDYLRKHPEMMEEVLQMSVNVNALLIERFFTRVEKDATAELCKFLLYYSEETEEGRVLPKEFTNLQISKFLSLHRVTVTNILSILKKYNCIERTNHGLLLRDIPLLTDFAEQRKTLKYK